MSMSVVSCKVTCPPKATVAGVRPGGEVELDPAKVNIKALVKAGFVQVIEKPAGEPEPSAEKSAGEPEKAAAKPGKK
jgi:hypothetical protein